MLSLGLIDHGFICISHINTLTFIKIGFQTSFYFFRFFLAYKYYDTHMSNYRFSIVIRNGKIVWKVVWIDYYLRLNLPLKFPKILVLRLPQNASNVNIECARKSKQLYSLCHQLLGALIYLHFIILMLICFYLVMPAVNYAIYIFSPF